MTGMKRDRVAVIAGQGALAAQRLEALVAQLEGDGARAEAGAAAQIAAPRAWPSSRVDFGLTLTKTCSTAAHCGR